MNDKDIETILGEIARLAKIGRMCEDACAHAPTDLRATLDSHDTPDASRITFAVGQKYTFSRTSFCGGTFKDYKKGDTITIRKVDDGVIDFDNGANISSATEEYLRDMIADGVITLTTQREGYEVSLSSVTDTVELPKPGQVYEFTKDCVFFDDISGDYKGYTIKEGATLTVSDALCSCEQFSISSSHPVHLSHDFILSAIRNGDLKLADIPDNPDEASDDSTSESPLKEGQVYEVAVDRRVAGPHGTSLFLKAGTKLTIGKCLNTVEKFRWSDFRKTSLSSRWITDALADKTIKLVEVATTSSDQFKFNRPFNFKEGQTYRVTNKIGCDLDIVKDDRLYIERVEDPYVICVIEKQRIRERFACDIFENWINDKILVLEDEEIVVKPGHKYRVTRDIKSNFTDELRHKEGGILEVTHVDEAYVSYRTGETNMRESVDKFRHLIALETLVLVGSEFKGEMSCEFKDGMKFKFSKEFARVCGVPGNDFYPGDTISLIPINRTDIAIINDRGYNTGTVKIEWLRERIEDGTLVPFADDQTSGSDDDMRFYDGEKFIVQMSFGFLSPKDDKTWHHLDKDQIITIGVNRDAPADEQIGLYRDANLLCYISRSTLISLIQHDRLKVKED